MVSPYVGRRLAGAVGDVAEMAAGGFQQHAEGRRQRRHRAAQSEQETASRGALDRILREALLDMSLDPTQTQAKIAEIMGTVQSPSDWLMKFDRDTRNELVGQSRTAHDEGVAGDRVVRTAAAEGLPAQLEASGGRTDVVRDVQAMTAAEATRSRQTEEQERAELGRSEISQAISAYMETPTFETWRGMQAIAAQHNQTVPLADPREMSDRAREEFRAEQAMWRQIMRDPLIDDKPAAFEAWRQAQSGDGTVVEPGTGDGGVVDVQSRIDAMLTTLNPAAQRAFLTDLLQSSNELAKQYAQTKLAEVGPLSRATIELDVPDVVAQAAGPPPAPAEPAPSAGQAARYWLNRGTGAVGGGAEFIHRQAASVGENLSRVPERARVIWGKVPEPIRRGLTAEQQIRVVRLPPEVLQLLEIEGLTAENFEERLRVAQERAQAGSVATLG